jgi:hypothetical protein
MDRDSRQPSLHTHLFTLRLWCEELGQGQIEWRGRIKHLGSGEVRYFRDPRTLYAALLRMLASMEEGDDLPDADAAR